MKKKIKTIIKLGIISVCISFISLMLIQNSYTIKEEVSGEKNNLVNENNDSIATPMAFTPATSDQLKKLNISLISYNITNFGTTFTYYNVNGAYSTSTTDTNVNVYRYDDGSTRKTFLFYRLATSAGSSTFSAWKLGIVPYGTGTSDGPNVNGKVTALNYAGAFLIEGVQCQLAVGNVSVDESGYVRISYGTVAYYITADGDFTTSKPATPSLATYTVTAKSSNSSYGQVSGTFSGGSGTTGRLQATSSTGYSFSYWLGSNGTRSTANPYSVAIDNSNVTYTAYFTPNKYSVITETFHLSSSNEYVSGGGGTITQSGSYDYNSTVTINVTVKPGYKFVGLVRVTDGESSVVSYKTTYQFTKGVGTDVFKAYFQPIKYVSNLRYAGVPNTDVTPFRTTFDYSLQITGFQTRFTGYSVVNYTFTNLGSTAQYSINGTTWYNITNNTVPANANYLRNLQLTDDAVVDVIANYKINSYIKAVSNTTPNYGIALVSYNNSTGASKSVVYEQDFTLLAQSKPGYEFVGWYASSACTETPLSTSASYTLTCDAQATTYYAKFKPINYILAVSINGKAPSQSQLTFDASYSLTSYASAEKGYTLTGYAISNASNTAQYSINGTTWYNISNNLVPANALYIRNLQTTSGAKATVNANYSINSYTKTVYNTTPLFGNALISYKSTLLASQSVVYNEGFTLTAKANTGYEFVGWYDTSACTGVPLSKLESFTLTCDDKTTTYYAKFQQKGIHIRSNTTNNEATKVFNSLKNAVDFAVANNITEIFIDGPIGSLYQNYNTFVNNASAFISYNSSMMLTITGIGANNIIYNNAANALINITQGEITFNNVTIYGTGKNNPAGNRDNALLRVAGGKLTLINSVVTNSYNIGEGIHYSPDWCPGTINVYNGELVLENTNLYGNTTTYGGDIFIQSGSLTINGGSISGVATSGIYAIYGSSIILNNANPSSVYLGTDVEFAISNITNSIDVYKAGFMLEGNSIGTTDATSANKISGVGQIELVGSYSSGDLIWAKAEVIKSKLQLAIEKANADKAFTIIQGEAVSLASALGKYVYHLNGCLYIGEVTVDSNFASVTGTGKRAVITGKKVGAIEVSLTDVRTRGCYYYGTTTINSIIITITVLPRMGDIVAGNSSIAITNCDADTTYSLYDATGSLLSTTIPTYDTQAGTYYVRFENGITSLTKYSIEASVLGTDKVTYMTTQNITTGNKPALQLAIENASGFYMNLGQTTTLSNILGNSVYHLRYCVSIANAKALSNADYITLSSGTKNATITANKVGYVDISLSAKTNGWCAVYGTVGTYIDDISIRIYILPAIKDSEVNITSTAITLPNKEGFEYSLDGQTWVTGTIDELKQNTPYNLYIRYTFNENGISKTLIGNYQFCTALDITNPTTMEEGIKNKLEEYKEQIKDLNLSEKVMSELEELFNKLETVTTESLSKETLNKIDEAINSLINNAKESSELEMGSLENEETIKNLEDYLDRLNGLTEDELISEGLDIINNNKDLVGNVDSFKETIKALDTQASLEEYKTAIDTFDSLSNEEKKILSPHIEKIIEEYKNKIISEIYDLESLSSAEHNHYINNINAAVSSEAEAINKLHIFCEEYQKAQANNQLNGIKDKYDAKPENFDTTINNIQVLEDISLLPEIVENGLKDIYEKHIIDLAAKVNTVAPDTFEYETITKTDKGYTYNDVEYEIFIDAFEEAIFKEQQNVIKKAIAEKIAVIEAELQAKTKLEVKNNPTDDKTIKEELKKNLDELRETLEALVTKQNSLDGLKEVLDSTSDALLVETAKADKIIAILDKVNAQKDKHASYEFNNIDEELKTIIINSLDGKLEAKKEEVISNIINSSTSSVIDSNALEITNEIEELDRLIDYNDELIKSFNDASASIVHKEVETALKDKFEGSINAIATSATLSYAYDELIAGKNEIQLLIQIDQAITSIKEHKETLSEEVDGVYQQKLEEIYTNSLDGIIASSSIEELNTLVKDIITSMDNEVIKYKQYQEMNSYAKIIENKVKVLSPLSDVEKELLYSSISTTLEQKLALLDTKTTLVDMLKVKEELIIALDGIYTNALTANEAFTNAYAAIDALTISPIVDAKYQTTLDTIKASSKAEIAISSSSDITSIVNLATQMVEDLKKISSDVKEYKTTATSKGIDATIIEKIENKAITAIVGGEEYDYVGLVDSIFAVADKYNTYSTTIDGLTLETYSKTDTTALYNETISALANGDNSITVEEFNSKIDTQTSIAQIEDQALKDLNLLTELSDLSRADYKKQISNEINKTIQIIKLNDTNSDQLVVNLFTDIAAIIATAEAENNSSDFVISKDIAKDFIAKVEESIPAENRPIGYEDLKKNIQDASNQEELDAAVHAFNEAIKTACKDLCDALIIEVKTQNIAILNNATVNKYDYFIDEYEANKESYDAKQLLTKYEELKAIKEFYDQANLEDSTINCLIKDNLVVSITSTNGDINTLLNGLIQEGLNAIINDDNLSLDKVNEELTLWEKFAPIYIASKAEVSPNTNDNYIIAIGDYVIDNDSSLANAYEWLVEDLSKVTAYLTPIEEAIETYIIDQTTIQPIIEALKKFVVDTTSLTNTIASYASVVQKLTSLGVEIDSNFATYIGDVVSLEETANCIFNTLEVTYDSEVETKLNTYIAEIKDLVIANDYTGAYYKEIVTELQYIKDIANPNALTTQEKVAILDIIDKYEEAKTNTVELENRVAVLEAELNGYLTQITDKELNTNFDIVSDKITELTAIKALTDTKEIDDRLSSLENYISNEMINDALIKKVNDNFTNQELKNYVIEAINSVGDDIATILEGALDIISKANQIAIAVDAYTKKLLATKPNQEELIANYIYGELNQETINTIDGLVSKYIKELMAEGAEESTITASYETSLDTLVLALEKDLAKDSITNYIELLNTDVTVDLTSITDALDSQAVKAEYTSLITLIDSRNDALASGYDSIDEAQSAGVSADVLDTIKQDYIADINTAGDQATIDNAKASLELTLAKKVGTIEIESIKLANPDYASTAIFTDITTKIEVANNTEAVKNIITDIEDKLAKLDALKDKTFILEEFLDKENVPFEDWINKIASNPSINCLLQSIGSNAASVIQDNIKEYVNTELSSNPVFTPLIIKAAIDKIPSNDLTSEATYQDVLNYYDVLNNFVNTTVAMQEAILQIESLPNLDQAKKDELIAELEGLTGETLNEEKITEIVNNAIEENSKEPVASLADYIAGIKEAVDNKEIAEQGNLPDEVYNSLNGQFNQTKEDIKNDINTATTISQVDAIYNQGNILLNEIISELNELKEKYNSFENEKTDTITKLNNMIDSLEGYPTNYFDNLKNEIAESGEFSDAQTFEELQNVKEKYEAKIEELVNDYERLQNSIIEAKTEIFIASNEAIVNVENLADIPSNVKDNYQEAIASVVTKFNNSLDDITNKTELDAAVTNAKKDLVDIAKQADKFDELYATISETCAIVKDAIALKEYFDTHFGIYEDAINEEAYITALEEIFKANADSLAKTTTYEELVEVNDSIKNAIDNLINAAIAVKDAISNDSDNINKYVEEAKTALDKQNTTDEYREKVLNDLDNYLDQIGRVTKDSEVEGIKNSVIASIEALTNAINTYEINAERERNKSSIENSISAIKSQIQGLDNYSLNKDKFDELILSLPTNIGDLLNAAKDLAELQKIISNLENKIEQILNSAQLMDTVYTEYEIVKADLEIIALDLEGIINDTINSILNNDDSKDLDDIYDDYRKAMLDKLNERFVSETDTTNSSSAIHSKDISVAIIELETLNKLFNQMFNTDKTDSIEEFLNEIIDEILANIATDTLLDDLRYITGLIEQEAFEVRDEDYIVNNIEDKIEALANDFETLITNEAYQTATEKEALSEIIVQIKDLTFVYNETTNALNKDALDYTDIVMSSLVNEAQSLEQKLVDYLESGNDILTNKALESIKTINELYNQGIDTTNYQKNTVLEDTITLIEQEVLDITQKIKEETNTSDLAEYVAKNHLIVDSYKELVNEYAHITADTTKYNKDKYNTYALDEIEKDLKDIYDQIIEEVISNPQTSISDIRAELLDTFEKYIDKYEALETKTPNDYISDLISELESIIISAGEKSLEGIILESLNEESFNNFEFAIIVYKEYTNQDTTYDAYIVEGLEVAMMGNLQAVIESGLYYEAELNKGNDYVIEFNNQIKEPELNYHTFDELYKNCVDNLANLDKAVDVAKKQLTEELEKMVDSDYYAKEQLDKAKEILDSFLHSLTDNMTTTRVDELIAETTDRLEELPEYNEVIAKDLNKLWETISNNNDYFDYELNEVKQIINTALAELANLQAKDEIDEYLNNVIYPALDEIKTAKESAVEEINEAMANLDLSEYTPISIDKIESIVNEALAELENTLTLEEIQRIIDSTKVAIDLVESIEDQSFTKVKAEAIDTLNKYKDDSVEGLDELVEDYLNEIKKVDPQTTTKEAVVDILNEAIDKIMELLVEYNLDEINRLEEGIALDNYSEAQQESITQIIDKAKVEVLDLDSVSELKEFIEELNKEIGLIPNKVDLAIKDASSSLEDKLAEILNKDFTDHGITSLADESIDEIIKKGLELQQAINGETVEEVKENLDKLIEDLIQFSEEVVNDQARKEIEQLIADYLKQDYQGDLSLEEVIDAKIDAYQGNVIDINTADYETQKAKNEVATEIENYFEAIDLKDYSTVNQDELKEIFDKAIADIYASAKEEIVDIIDNAKQQIQGVPTLQEEETSSAKDKAIDYLDKYNDGSHNLAELIEIKKEIIANLATDATSTEIDAALNEAIQDIYTEKLENLEKEYSDITLNEIFTKAIEEVSNAKTKDEYENIYQNLLDALEERQSILDIFDDYLAKELSQEAKSLVEEAIDVIKNCVETDSMLNQTNKYIVLIDKQILKDEIAKAIEEINKAYATYDSRDYTATNYQLITEYRSEAIEIIQSAKALSTVSKNKVKYLELMDLVETIVETAIEGLEEYLNILESSKMEEILEKWENELNKLEPNTDGKYEFNGQIFDSISEVVEKVVASASAEFREQLNKEAVEKAIKELTEYKDKLIVLDRFSEKGIESITSVYEDAVVDLEALDLKALDIAENILEIVTNTKADMNAILAEFTTTKDNNLGKDTQIIDYPNGYDYNAGLWGNVALNKDAIGIDTNLVVEKQEETYVEIAKEVYEANKKEATTEINIEKSEVKELLDIYLVENNKRVRIEGDNVIYTVSILIPQEYRNVRELSIIHIKDDGSIEFFSSKIIDNLLTFETSHFSDYAIVGMTFTEQYREETLEETNEIFSNIDSTKFNHGQWQQIRDIYNETLSRLDGKNISASDMETILLDFINQIEEHPTAIDAKKAEALKELAKEFAKYDESDYSDKEYQKIVDAYKEAVDNVNKATDISQIEEATKAAKSSMAKSTTIGFIVWVVIGCVLGLFALLVLILILFYFRVIIMDEDEEITYKRRIWLFKVKVDNLKVTKEGYTLKGLYSDIKFKNKLEDFRMPFGRVTVYSTWTINEIEILYNKPQEMLQAIENSFTPLISDEKVVEAISSNKQIEDSIDEKEKMENIIFKSYDPLVSYSMSLESKLALGSDSLNDYYNQVKNKILSYTVKNRLSFKKESFYKGREVLVVLTARGKTLNAYIALDLDYCRSKNIRAFEPNNSFAKEKKLTLIKVTSDLQLRKFLSLIDDLMTMREIKANKKHEKTDYTKEYRNLSKEELVAMGKIKIFRKRLMQSVNASDVNKYMSDDLLAAMHIAKEKIHGPVGKKTIINLDTINKIFEEGSVIDITALKQHKLIDKNAEYVKVLARGSISKSFIIKANAYSKEAMKMILLTGGEIVLLEK